MKYLPVFVFALVTFWGCKKTIVVTAPTETYLKRKYEPGVSEINVPVSIPIKNLTEKLNKEVKGLLYEDSSLENNNEDNLLLKVWKHSDFKVSVNKDRFEYEIPLKIWVKYGKEVFGVEAFGEGNFEIKMKFKTSLVMDSTWRVITHTESDGYEWITPPTLAIAGVEMPIKWIANILLKYQKETLGKTVDDMVKQNLDVHTYAASIWKNIQVPIQVSSDPNVWLRISPKKFSMSPFYGDFGTIKSSLGLIAVTETILGEKPEVISDLHLPNLVVTNQEKDDFFITLSTDIPYSTATEIARKLQVGQVYDFKDGKYKIKVVDMEIYGSGEEMIVKTLLEGSLNGFVYLTGTPVYDEVKQTISLKNVRYDMNTKNALMKTADWMFHGIFEKKLQESMVFSIKEDVANQKKEIEKSLKNNRIPPGILLNGKLGSLDVKDIFLTPHGIKTFVEIKGNLNITIDSF